jgi:hypothetical protein
VIPDWLVAAGELFLDVTLLALLALLQLPRERGERIVRAIVNAVFGKKSNGGN